ncbi:MAG: hypothetical protein QOG89_2432, partial [Thermomicrobiales bacterium]|nr:hypothetical protein [Thermomicrobiales bacterium]
MKRTVLALVLVVVALLPVGVQPGRQRVIAQDGDVPSGTPVSQPVRAGAWTFQVLAAERLDRYYAERLGQVFTPDGVFLIVSLAITYEGDSTNEIDRLVASGV